MSNMIKILSIRPYLHSVRRNFSTPVPPSSEAGSAVRNMSPKYRPTDFQKFVLVWTKKFKTKEEIPALVSPELIDRARSEARIKISNILIVLTALASFGAILVGKAAAKRGESVHQMNLDWHKKYQDDFNKKQESAPKA